jgi:hypothetical protein
VELEKRKVQDLFQCAASGRAAAIGLRDELVEQAIDEGGSIEHVEVDTKAGTPPGRSSPAVPVAPVPSIR